MTIIWIDKMAVDARGDGDPIVMVHGLGGSMNAWTPLLPALSRWRSVRLDLPGAARSNKAYAASDDSPHRGSLSSEGHADAVLRVCEALGITRAHFVGHSFGTLICQQVAVKAPQLVRSMALFGALLEPPQAMRDGLRTRAAQARERGMLEIAESVSDFALSASTRQTQPVTVAYLRECMVAQPAEGYARNCLALSDAQATRTEMIHCPVLIVNGDEDRVTPLSGARQLADRLSNARVEVLSRCGHWPMLERTLESQRALSGFLERVR